MRAYVLRSQGHMEYMEKSVPEIKKETGVLLKSMLVSPCSSDINTIYYGSPKKENLTLGHEVIAEVIKTGKEVRDFKEGDIVCVPAITPDWDNPDCLINPGHCGTNFSGHALGKSIDGAFQEIFYLPMADRNLSLLPPGMSPYDALMCNDVMLTGLTAVRGACVKKGDTVTVFGIGAIGLSSIMWAKLFGASRIFCVGSREKNKEIAESLGAEVIDYKTVKCSLPEGIHERANSTSSQLVNKILFETGGKGTDACIIAGGGSDILMEACDTVKYGTGIVSNVASFQGERISLPVFSLGKGMAGKTFRFSLSLGGRENLEYVLKEVEKNSLHPGIFVTNVFEGFQGIKEAIDLMKDKKAIKTAVWLEKFGN